jgi:hypothetical protein
MAGQGGPAPEDANELADRTARAGKALHKGPDLLRGARHRGGPGRAPVRDDPHAREPVAREPDQLVPRPERDQHVRPLIVDLIQGGPEVGGAGGELPVGGHGGPLQLPEGIGVGGDAEDGERSAQR